MNNKMNTQYMNQNKWMQEYLKMSNQDNCETKQPYMTSVENGYILPCKASPTRAWGVGGVLDNSKKFVEASLVGTAFGGKYDFDSEYVRTIDETVVYVPVIPKHWGHFLIDCVCRFWFVPEDQGKHKIAYCSWNWDNEPVSGNYLDFLNLLGVKESMLLNITEPTKFSKILIPSATFGYAINYNRRYYEIIQTAVVRALQSEETRYLQKFDKIYFTRTQFNKACKTEVGEKRIERQFELNGFHILAPEKLSIREQIFYINNCKEMASLSGTVPHNAMFLSKEGALTILNRTCVPNPPQFRINQLFNINYTYVDVYNKWTEKHPRTYGGEDGSPIWVETNENLKQFFDDKGWKYVNSTSTYAGKLVDTIHFYCIWFYKCMKKRLKIFR